MSCLESQMALQNHARSSLGTCFNIRAGRPEGRSLDEPPATSFLSCYTWLSGTGDRIERSRNDEGPLNHFMFYGYHSSSCTSSFIASAGPSPAGPGPGPTPGASEAIAPSAGVAPRAELGPTLPATPSTVRFSAKTPLS